jgi:hypothetical protein
MLDSAYAPPRPTTTPVRKLTSRAISTRLFWFNTYLPIALLYYASTFPKGAFSRVGLPLYGVLRSWKRLRAIQYEGHPHGVAFMVACAFALLTAPVVAFARTSDNPKRRGAHEIAEVPVRYFSNGVGEREEAMEADKYEVLSFDCYGTLVAGRAG